jgi:hypothetical protein
MFGGPEVSYHQTYSARDWLSILRTPYPTQNLQRKYKILKIDIKKNTFFVASTVHNKGTFDEDP